MTTRTHDRSGRLRPGVSISFRWTGPRLLGLAAFREDGTARESNSTGVDAYGDPMVYWQVRRWLEEQGLIVPCDDLPCWWRLTPRGVVELDRFAWTQSSFDGLVPLGETDEPRMPPRGSR